MSSEDNNLFGLVGKLFLAVLIFSLLAWLVPRGITWIVGNQWGELGEARQARPGAPKHWTTMVDAHGRNLRYDLPTDRWVEYDPNPDYWLGPKVAFGAAAVIMLLIIGYQRWEARPARRELSAKQSQLPAYGDWGKWSAEEKTSYWKVMAVLIGIIVAILGTALILGEVLKDPYYR